jgi:geranylgeranyl transferase type-2 subunit beta
MKTGYLELLDELLAMGTAAFSPAFRDRQLAFLLTQQQLDGGFAGRQGRADLYYSDFALRALALLDYHGPAWGQAAAFLVAQPLPRGEVAALFNLLNGARLLSRQGQGLSLAFALPDLRATLHDCAAQSAYALFLGTLCAHMLDDGYRSAAETAALLSSLRCPGGGYCNVSGISAMQTNATAAAMAVYRMLELPVDCLREDAATLARLQRADGGWPAHESAPASDLLSTFTALLTLAGMGELSGVRLPAIAQFLKETAEPNGGFRAGAGDDTADVEYSYYGIATLALLRAQVEALTG